AGDHEQVFGELAKGGRELQSGCLGHESILRKLSPFSVEKPGTPLPAGALLASPERTLAK
ncbi:hypothetical protein NLU14_18865, partial [Marinobacter sp. 71-i]